MYEYISNNEADLNAFLNTKLSTYLVNGDSLQIDVFLLLGGTSDGFSKGNIFSIDIGFYKDDIEGMKLLLLHEMFHIVQYHLSRNLKKINLSKNQESVLDLMRNVFKEGSASFIANPLKVDNPKEYTKWFQGKYKLNANRIQDNFQLMNNAFYRLIYDKSSTIDDVYNLGFSARWESPLYYVGLRMCELIYKYEGENFLNAYLIKSPDQFFLNYNKYATKENLPEKFPILDKTINAYIEKISKK